MFITVLVRIDGFLKLELNALGDFLAGTFSPLALLWLVIGYFQQGDELRQNSRALHLQAEELRQAAEHAGGLLDVARKEHALAMEKLSEEQRRRELEAERQAEAQERRRKNSLQPRFNFGYGHPNANGTATIKLTNDGHDCAAFSLELPGNEVLKLLQSVKAENLKARASLFISVAALKTLGTTLLLAHWTDVEGDHHRSKFIASVADNRIEINI